jgi:NIMA (never in mitosis gene a)-related kinase
MGDLRELISAKAKDGEEYYTEPQIWSWFLQICQGLHFMHGRRVLHRDIKPANVIITDSGLKLADLGLGRYMSSATLETYSSVGTPCYMSPEMVMARGYHFPSDMWSLGCLLYELAALRPPFFDRSGNFYQLGKMIKSCEFDALPAHYTDAMHSLVKKMITADPAQRPSIDVVLAEVTAAHALWQ